MSSGDVTPFHQGERLRVAHLVKEYLPYSASWIFHQITGPAQVETLTIAWEGSDESLEAFPNSGLHRVNRSRPMFYCLTRLLAPAGIRWISQAAKSPLRRFSPDLAHAHFGHYAWFYLPAVKALRLPLVVSFYGHDMSELPKIRPIWRRRYAELFEYGRLFFCEGPAMAEGLEALGCPAGKVRVQGLGVDCPRVALEPRLFQPGEALRVLLVGRMTEKKGIPDAIRAVALALRRVPVRMTVVGDRAPGRKGRKEEKRIRKAIQETGIGGSVTFTGRLPYEKIFQIAGEHHVLLQPSRTSSMGDTEGGIPVSLIELGATGMAAVATRHADIPLVVRDGETGLLCDEEDIEALAEALVRLATGPELIRRMGLAMARYVAEHFAQSDCHAQLVRHYREALSQ
jgi:colanic acid/amylovoran biosynthesis glycosyltransferase